jgi:hypothetical protein
MLDDRLLRKVKRSVADRLYVFDALFVAYPDDDRPLPRDRVGRGWVTVNASDKGRRYINQLFTGRLRFVWRRSPGELVPESRGGDINVRAARRANVIEFPLEAWGVNVSEASSPDALAFLLAATVSDERQAVTPAITAGFFASLTGDRRDAEVGVIRPWEPTRRGSLPEPIRTWVDQWWPSRRRRQSAM